MAQCTNCWSWHTHGGNCEIHNATGGNADAPSTAPRRDCVHGCLARSCEICEYEGELSSLRTELSRLRAVIEEARAMLGFNGNFYTPRATVIAILDRGLNGAGDE